VLCLFTYRPGYIHPFGEWTYHTRLVLPLLSTQDSMPMAQAILATEQLPAALHRKHVARARWLQGESLTACGRLEEAAQILTASVRLAEQIQTPREV
jgi:hypothetical protein